MKKLLLVFFIAMWLAYPIFAQAPNQEVVKIDKDNIELITHVTQRIEKKDLLDRKKMLEADVIRDRMEIEAIDRLLGHFE